MSRVLALLLLAFGCVASSYARDAGDPEREMVQELNRRYPVEFRARVNQAILRGAKFLLNTQQPNGSWPSGTNGGYPMGASALATLTLHKAGIPATHPAMLNAWRYLHALPLEKTYSVAVLLMALEAKIEADTKADEENAPDITPSKQRHRRQPLMLKADRDLMQRAVAFLLKHQNKNGAWRYPSKSFDLSCTQYALLGLRAGVRCGAKVAPSVWLRALDFLLDWQVPSGKPVALRVNEVRGTYRVSWMEKAQARGFTYATRNQPTSGAMTTAGLAGLVICQSELWSSRRFKGKKRRATRLAARDAMAWLQLHFDVRWNPIEGRPMPDRPGVNPGHLYYYLYGLERAGILTRARYFGTRDWYEEGAELFLHDQDLADDGGWPGHTGRRTVPTCFALLFLKRATRKVQLPVTTPSTPATPPEPQEAPQEGASQR